MSMPSTSSSAKSSTSKAVEKTTDSKNCDGSSGSEGVHPVASTSWQSQLEPADKQPLKKDNSCLIAAGSCSCSSTLDDPKPGPSTTAADFDLEVFDSCSSCSLEDCWGVDCPNSSCESSPTSRTPPESALVSGGVQNKSFHRKGNKKPRSNDGGTSSRSCRQKAVAFPSDLSDNSSEDDFVMSSPQVDKILAAAAEEVTMDNSAESVYEPTSACPSETEEASDREEPEDAEGERGATEEERADLDSDVDVASTCWFAAAPEEAGKDAATAEVDCRFHDNIDEIVQDHDNFGTDENEDSLDSMATMADDDAVGEGGLSGNKRKSGRSSPEVCLKKKRSSTIFGSISGAATAAVERNDEMCCDSKLTFSGDSTAAMPATATAPCLVSGDPEAETEFCSTIGSTTTSTRLKNDGRAKGIGSVSASDSSRKGATARQKHGHEQQHTMLIPDKDNPPREMLDWVESFSRWSHAQRLLAIDQLIGRCEPTQVRHMMAVIEPQFQRDFISLLPKELALYVLSFLKPRDLLIAAQTCRYWRILAEDNLLWREKCREAGLGDVREVLNSRRRKPGNSSFAYSPWKLGFIRELNIENNWRSGPLRQPKVLKGHDDHVITCLQFNNNRIVSGSDDNTLKVWNAISGRCLRTLIGHTGGVWSSQMEGNVIVSGSTDRTLKVWNADTGVCEHTLYGHTSTVRCMHLHENLVVSGSRDATLRMWDIATGECLHVLMGHVAAVRCVQYDGRLVVSGAYDYMVKVWNPITEECLHTLTGHTNRVYSLQFDGVHVVSGSLDTSIRVWDVESGACKHALMGHQSLTSGMELKDNILVSGNADSTVKVWDITTGQCLQTLSGPNKHQSAVTCLQFNSKFVVTSSDDGTVKLWDVKTGEFIRDLVALKSGGSGGVVWRIRANSTKLVCAVGSRNGTEETKLLVLDFDVADPK